MYPILCDKRSAYNCVQLTVSKVHTSTTARCSLFRSREGVNVKEPGGERNNRRRAESLDLDGAKKPKADPLREE